MKKLKIYKTDGSIEEREVPDEFPLKILQDIVEGYIELVPPAHTKEKIPGRELYCNEEGIYLNLPPNPHFLNILGTVVEVIPSEVLNGR